jgi:CHAT domain-containing protein/Tfp pilus assembly protein PilF
MKTTCYVLLAALLGFIRPAASQNPADRADAAYRAGMDLFLQEKFAQAFLKFEEAAALFPGNQPEHAKALHQACECLFQEGKFDEALQSCTRALTVRQLLLPDNHPDLALTLRRLGLITRERGQFAESLPFFEKALEINKTAFGDTSLVYAELLGLLGKSHGYLDHYEQAIALQERSLVICRRLLPPNDPGLAISCNRLGRYFRSLHRYDEALDYFHQALAMHRVALKPGHHYFSHSYSEIGQIWLAKGEPGKALEYFQKSDSILVKLEVTQEVAYAHICANLGQAFQALGQYPAAVEWHSRALAIFRAAYSEVPTQYASALLDVAGARMAGGDLDGAIPFYREAERIWTGSPGPERFNAHAAQAGLARAYQQWFLKTGRDSLLERSRHYFRLAEQPIEEKLDREISGLAQRKVIAEAVPVFESAIRTEMLYLERYSGDTAALEKAWQLSEAMHGYLLFAATQEADARHFAGIPDSLLARDSQLRTNVTALEKARQTLLENRGLGLTDSLVLVQNARIFARKEESRRLRAFFETTYPDYFRLRLDFRTASLPETQRLLGPEQTLLEFFTGDSSIFVFVVRPHDRRVIELPRRFPLAAWVRDLRQGISGYHTATRKTPDLFQSSVSQYARAAHNLYENLLAPLEPFLSAELIIIPGDELADLPFEALLTAPPRDLINFGTYPYLLRRHTVHYGYSATMLHQMAGRRHRTAGRGLLALAPFFTEDTTGMALRLRHDTRLRGELLPLPFSGEEVYRVSKRHGEPSVVLTGRQATKPRFLELAPAFRVLHLATHGKANRSAGDFSYLAFSATEGQPENGLLSVGELYNCSLNADMVVLSACEAGIGELQRGEGVISLARAFAFAGAKSIVTSMWSVPDQSTMRLMDFFYAELTLGQPKNRALSAAKQRYLRDSPGLNAHPFFWAGFVAVGDMGRL